MKVLTISRNYPNQVLPQLGLWVEGLVRETSRLGEQQVISPVPYSPPLPRFARRFTRFREIPGREIRSGIPVWHPRFLSGPGYSLHNFEGMATYLGIRPAVDRLRRHFPFDLIHAHFVYPDGAAAARLGRRYGVPVVITEHALWQPWLDHYPRVRRQAVEAVRQASFQLVASRYLRDSVVGVTGMPEKIRLVPIGFNRSIFHRGDRPVHLANQLIFVGRLQPVKGLDILLQALARLVKKEPSLRLLIVGGPLYGEEDYQGEVLEPLVRELALDGNVEFTGLKAPEEVARLLRESAVMVLPSRRESFGAVLVEALACGTPVVATRCGGPEDIVTPEAGRLAANGDPEDLAAAIWQVLGERERYDPEHLSALAHRQYTWQKIAAQTMEIYREAIAGHRGRRAPQQNVMPVIDREKEK